jgi:hypothetical protein
MSSGWTAQITILEGRVHALRGNTRRKRSIPPAFSDIGKEKRTRNHPGWKTRAEELPHAWNSRIS